MVLYIDGGRVSSSNFRGIAALGAVMFKKMSVRLRHTVIGSNRLNWLN